MKRHVSALCFVLEQTLFWASGHFQLVTYQAAHSHAGDVLVAKRRFLHCQ